jgi:hypothetical protein
VSLIPRYMSQNDCYRPRGLGNRSHGLANWASWIRLIASWICSWITYLAHGLGKWPHELGIRHLEHVMITISLNRVKQNFPSNEKRLFYFDVRN